MSQRFSIPSEAVNFDALPDSAHVRLPVVTILFARSKASIWRDVRAGRLPPPRKCGPRVSAWNVGELRAILAGKAGAR